MSTNNSIAGGHNISRIMAAAAQAVGLQLLSVLFFYLLSLHLDKSQFGLISWANAVAFTLVVIMWLGLEQVVARRISAGGSSSDWAVTAFLLHTIIAGALLFIPILGAFYLLPAQHERVVALLAFFGIQCCVALVAPFRLLFNARGRLVPYAVIGLLSNTGRIAALVLWVKSGRPLTISGIALMLVLFSFAELISIITLAYAKGLMPGWPRIKAYRLLLKESLPQYVSTIFDVSLARTDWILLGLLSTNAMLGEYSFAYRAFEISKMPTTIINLLLMPRAAGLLAKPGAFTAEKMGLLKRFFGAEMWLAALLALAICAFWVPLIGSITGGKYGLSDAGMLYWLAATIPFHIAVNFCWILLFAARRYKAISMAILISSLVNIVLNVVLIPVYGGEGAAIAFFASSLVQVIFYYRSLRKFVFTMNVTPLIVASLCAVAAFFGLRLFHTHLWISAAAVCILFAIVPLLLKAWHPRNIRKLLREF